MKKNVLALSIAAMIGGFAGAASAAPANTGSIHQQGAQTPADATDFAFAEGGAGHILMVPYFSTQNENMSVIHVVNTDSANGKALKVRFRGAANSDDVLDFTVFLSPGDVWTGSVQADENGSYFQTSDKSCTLPTSVMNGKTSFVQDRLSEKWDAAKRANNTKEGYIEILNMADIVKLNDEGKATPLWTATKHVNGVAPCDDATLLQTLDLSPASDKAALANFGYNTPTGGLTGDWYIMNVAQTTTFSGAATALQATGGKGVANFVAYPQDGVELGAGVADANTADPLFLTATDSVFNGTGKPTTLTLPLIKAANYDLPDLSTPYLSNSTTPDAQVVKLTNAVANAGVSNQFANAKLVDAKTDWVLSMPTRRYHVGAFYDAATANDYRVFNAKLHAAPAMFTAGNTTVDENGNICVKTGGNVFHDREEAEKQNGAVVSPGKVTTVSLCGEVNVLSFNDAGNSVLGASVARKDLAVPYTNGWGKINYSALPVVGASFIKMTNAGGLANNFSGTYGVTWPHRFAK